MGSITSKWYLHFALGNEELRRGNFDAAILAYKNADAEEPNKAEVLASLGYAFLITRNLIEAEKFYKKCLAVDPNFHDAWLHYGISRLYQNDFENAEKLFDQCLLIKPNSFLALRARGECLAQLNRLPEAKDCLTQALKVQPSFTETKVDLATLYLHSSKAKEAKANLAEVIQEDPKNQRAFVLMQSLNRTESCI
ncbi:MAG: repeat-containing protein [Bacteriovoracaceae bacterium]|nr:repeat-containing protein [Bacteriovoracaceae bacterium]